MTSRVNTGKRSQRGDRLLANPVPCPGLLGPGKNFLKRLGARYAEPLPAGSVARQELYEARRPALAGPP
jgi:hypothetical protein